ncbi:MAG: hypothetical protein HOH80_09660 [Rhodospirillaceae bacterium]|jgi:hypothetical protein|nr:hypothetical protein [Rhodospirillaceae bacterium]MBT4118711.1 hypothetical protein [Rhodospirillaceae bacterium]MBT4670819.1 hypothetical protein [Rhodospirillaceae bacterium]MBT4717998.1 hypothetical protein [Rhodospirillaceae bacterium]MBT5180482.1 hypothetical protein [Rhodospirillaceae bacterium]
MNEITSTPSIDTELKSRHEAFARAYAAGAGGAGAARSAGYGPAGAAQRASELLRRDDVAARIAELNGETAAADREERRELITKLEPVFESALEAADIDAVLQVVELQARIRGFISGGATIRPRGFRSSAPGAYDPSAGHMAFLDHLDEIAARKAKPEAA